MIHDISRAELFTLFLILDVPKMVKERFAEVGIMNVVIPLTEADERKYFFNEGSFHCVPDKDYMDMHSNLRQFCRWYWIRYDRMKQQVKDFEYEDLEKAAISFAEQFISVWRKFTIKKI